MDRGPNDPLDQGRVVYDERGRACWEWRSADGAVHRETDPARIAKILEPRSTEVTLTAGEGDLSHRTLDDMRALSEEIKQRRNHAGAPQEPMLLRRAR